MTFFKVTRWTRPDHYVGAEHHEWFVTLYQHRDSDTLERSNFRSLLKLLGGESETVKVVRERHWAVGWIEWIGIHQSDTARLKVATLIVEDLNDYPVVDDEDFSELEREVANETWRNCFSTEERIEYIRENRNQFEFCDFRDLLAQVRGEYFGGYASEFLA